MVLVLAVERRFAADRAAAGGPARSRQSRPVAGCPSAAVRPRLWSGIGPQPATPPPVGGGSPVAECPGARRWQNAREMRSPTSGRGKISPRCVPGRRSVAAFSLHAFPKGLRTGKTPVRGKISPPCIRNGLALARYLRHASEKRRKQPSENTPREDLAMKGPLSLRGPLKSCTARGSCRRSALAGRRALCVEGRGAGLRKRTPYCCRRSRAPARHLVALCGGSLSRSKRLALRHAALAVTIPRCDRPVLQPTPRPLSVGSGFP